MMAAKRYARTLSSRWTSSLPHGFADPRRVAEEDDKQQQPPPLDQYQPQPQQQRGERRRAYHATAERPIMLLAGVLAVGGLGYVGYKALRGENLTPPSAVRAQEAYRRHEEELKKGRGQAHQYGAKPAWRSEPTRSSR